MCHKIVEKETIFCYIVSCIVSLLFRQFAFCICKVSKSK